MPKAGTRRGDWITGNGVEAAISPKPPDMSQQESTQKAGNRGRAERARLRETLDFRGFDEI